MNTRKIAGVVLVLAGISIGLAGPAEATKGSDHKQSICHPVNGKGELGNGWDLIPPDKASSHIDESLYPNGHYWKHEAKDGRHDIFATNGTCPSSPDPTTSTVTTSSTTTAPPTETTTTVPTISTTTSSSSTTSTATSSTTTTSTPSTTTTAVVPTTSTLTPTSTVPTKEVTKPKPVIKKPVVKQQAPTELAFTGPLNLLYAIIGVLFVLVGTAMLFAGRKIKVIRNG